MNEVLAHLANQRLAEQSQNEVRVHPNDDVNRSQSSNDTFPTAMHIATVIKAENQLLPALKRFKATLAEKEAENENVVKIGRTHLQDATPLTFAQEISGWKRMIEKCEDMIITSLDYVRELAIGGTAVGTGLNSPEGFGDEVARQLSEQTGVKLAAAKNYFQALTSHDELVHFHGALKL